MPDLPKQELDELFREGAGMQQFEYNEAAWDKMETMLDDDDKNRKIGIWLLLLIGVALAVIGGLYYSSLSDGSSSAEVILASENVIFKESSQEAEIAQQVVNAQVENDDIGNKIDNDNDVFAIQSVESEGIGIIKSNTDKQKLTSIALENNAKTTSNTSIITPSESRSTSVTSNRSASAYHTPILSNDRVDESAIPSSDILVVNQSIDESEVGTRELIDVRSLQHNYQEKLIPSKRDILPKLAPIDVALARQDESAAEKSFANRFSYALFIAPEWSSIGVDGSKKMGYKFGAKVGFQLSDKLELSSGFSLSQKKFNGKGSEFTITEGWVDNIMPMAMDAKCNIIEIPLDLSYHFNGVGNSGFVMGLGVRSFMLHSEWYGFEYNKLQYRPGLLEEKVMDNQNKNWVGSIELSLGYSKKVNDNLSVQVVPYLQIPIAGIGEGKVDLYSGGVQFAVRFDGK